MVVKSRQSIRVITQFLENNMPQLQPGESFENGQQVTAERLNTHVAGAIALPGLIAEQPTFGLNPGTGLPVAEPDLETTDKILVLDESEDAIRKLDVGQILVSGFPVTFGDITLSNNPLTPFVRTIVAESSLADDKNGRMVIFGESVNDSAGALVQIGNAASGRELPASPDVWLAGRTLISGTPTEKCLLVDGISEFKDKVTLSTTKALKVPVGTEAQKPNETDRVIGDFRFNTNINRLEIFNGTDWKQVNQLEDLVNATYSRSVNPVGVPDSTAGWSNAGTVFQWRTGSEIEVPEGQVWEYTIIGRLSSEGTNGNTMQEYNHDAVMYIGDTEVRRTRVWAPNDKGQMIFAMKIDVTSADTSVPRRVGLKFLQGGGNPKVGVSAENSVMIVTVTKRSASANTEIADIL